MSHYLKQMFEWFMSDSWQTENLLNDQFTSDTQKGQKSIEL